MILYNVLILQGKKKLQVREEKKKQRKVLIGWEEFDAYAFYQSQRAEVLMQSFCTSYREVNSFCIPVYSVQHRACVSCFSQNALQRLQTR